MKFIRYTLSFSFATLISRILGYIRDLVIAAFFGANILTDAFFIAWRLPNTFRQVLGEGSFNAVFIPIFRSLEKNKQDTEKFINTVFTYLNIILFLLTVFVLIFAQYVAAILAPGFVGKEFFDEVVRLIQFVFPYIIFAGWVAFFMALLNLKGIFFLPAFTPALLNISFIVSAVFLSDFLGIYSLAVGAIFGGILQVLLLLKPALEHFKLRFYFSLSDEIKLLLKRLVPTITSFGITQVGFIIDTVIASLVMPGAISYLYYANRLLQLPLGVFGIGLGNAVLVALSEYSKGIEDEKIKIEFTLALRLAVVVSVPATLGLITLSEPIIDVLFHRGNFNGEDLKYTSYALIGLAMGLVPIIVQKPVKSVFFSLEDVKTPLYATLVGVLSGVIAALFFVFVFHMGVFGLAVATSLNYFITLLYLFLFLPIGFYKSELFKTALKSGFATCIMVAFIITVKRFFESSLVIILIAIPFGAVVYFLVLFLLRESSLKTLLKFGK